VYNKGIVDFDIEMKNGHKVILYCLAGKKMKDVLVGCFIN